MNNDEIRTRMLAVVDRLRVDQEPLTNDERLSCRFAVMFTTLAVSLLTSFVISAVIDKVYLTLDLILTDKAAREAQGN